MQPKTSHCPTSRPPPAIFPSVFLSKKLRAVQPSASPPRRAFLCSGVRIPFQQPRQSLPRSAASTFAVSRSSGAIVKRKRRFAAFPTATRLPIRPETVTCPSLSEVGSLFSNLARCGKFQIFEMVLDVPATLLYFWGVKWEYIKSYFNEKCVYILICRPYIAILIFVLLLLGTIFVWLCLRNCAINVSFTAYI